MAPPTGVGADTMGRVVPVSRSHGRCRRASCLNFTPRKTGFSVQSGFLRAVGVSLCSQGFSVQSGLLAGGGSAARQGVLGAARVSEARQGFLRGKGFWARQGFLGAARVSGRGKGFWAR